MANGERDYERRPRRQVASTAGWAEAGAGRRVGLLGRPSVVVREIAAPATFGLPQAVASDMEPNGRAAGVLWLVLHLGP